MDKIIVFDRNDLKKEQKFLPTEQITMEDIKDDLKSPLALGYYTAIYFADISDTQVKILKYKYGIQNCMANKTVIDFFYQWNRKD